MKKYFIFIGAVAAVVITTAFAYTYQEGSVPQTISVPASARATFVVGDKTYEVPVAPDETVIRAMRSLALAGDFIYTSRQHPGLGEFVDSINGAKNAGGMYWMLYINGVSASAGASATLLHAGDVIEWRYEKSF
ncbi:MAG: DUF4430 domain-containing protein [bacterium]|nr:DUF4430 domain-containing protein [bacterium]